MKRRQFLKASSASIAGAVGVTAATGTAAAHYVGLPTYTTTDLSVRDGPGTGYTRIAIAEQYTGGYIVDGPVSADGYTWWKIQYNGDSNNGRVTGWSAEGDGWLANADFAYPATGIVSSVYGEDRGSYTHDALDIANDVGTPIRAAREGTVAYTGYEADGCGNYIKIDHGGGWQTMYCHLSEVWVSGGESVDRFQQIGEMGNTGSSTGSHIHFTVEKDGVHQYVPGDYDDEIRVRTGLPKNYGIGSF
jgi:murein DD-endopeptidase MepM/ murein hydrolase activator NlpD